MVTEAGDEVELSVESIGSGGAGVGRLPDGRVVFVHRTAPGDRARVAVTEVRKRWARARLLEILEPGGQRRPAPCPHYDRCGGCTLEHLEYEAQIQVKGRIVVDALTRIGGRTSLPQPELHPSPRELRYRNRVSFTLRRLPGTGTRVVAGFHELEHPARILDVDGRCLLPEEPVARAWEALRESWGLGARRLPAGAELRLTLRGTEDGSVVLLVERGRREAKGRREASEARGTGRGTGTGAMGGSDGGEGDRSRGQPGSEGEGDPLALLQKVPALRAIWFWSHEGEPVLLAGEAEVEESWYGERIPIRPGAFFQVNREAAKHLHDLVLREAGAPKGRRILDAYCGFGVYGRRLARHGGTAVGIDADAQAVAMSRARPIDGFRVLEGRVEDRLEEALPADLVILNPPRGGVAEGVIERLAEGLSDGARGEPAPPRIIYISCDPATLARDVGRLGPRYRISRLQVVDLFPQTAHVETLLTLDRTEATTERL